MKTISALFKNDIIKAFDFHIGQVLLEEDDGELWNETERVFPIGLNEESLKFFYAYATKFNLPKSICVLMAHGDAIDDEWVYYDDLQKPCAAYATVASFIEEHDGKYAVIILRTCNPEEQIPQTQKSCVVFGDGLIGLKTLHSHDEFIYRALPHFEEVTAYTITFDTKALLGKRKLPKGFFV